MTCVVVASGDERCSEKDRENVAHYVGAMGRHCGMSDCMAQALVDCSGKKERWVSWECEKASRFFRECIVAWLRRNSPCKDVVGHAESHLNRLERSCEGSRRGGPSEHAISMDVDRPCLDEAEKSCGELIEPMLSCNCLFGSQECCQRVVDYIRCLEEAPTNAQCEAFVQDVLGDLNLASQACQEHESEASSQAERPASPSSSPEELMSNSTTPESTSGSSECLHGDSIVELVSGELVNVASLEIGDIVRSGKHSFSPIYFISHQDEARRARFTRITTKMGRIVRVTDDHLLHTVEGPLAARRITVGIALISVLGEVDEVVEKRAEVSVGVYMPHTLDGTIVVEGLVASCFNSAIPPSLGHALLLVERIAFLFHRKLLASCTSQGRPALLSFLVSLGREIHSHHCDG